MKKNLSCNKTLYYYFDNFIDSLSNVDHVAYCKSSINSSGSKLYQIGFYIDDKNVVVLDLDSTVSINNFTLLFSKNNKLCFSFFYDYNILLAFNDLDQKLNEFKSDVIDYIADNIIFHN